MIEQNRQKQTACVNALLELINTAGFSAYNIHLHCDRWEEVTMSIYLKNKKGFLRYIDKKREGQAQEEGGIYEIE